ncbi:protein vreteno isoform X2 [Drosophila ananassae]|uniref:protein vreteno isoform X2 n=1 Tax=Drosophila ananassae TaxID=7217 RepID=UPI0013A5C8B0|nr:protein vreteno isoform X2 [Drosophila ananassae]
MTGRNGMLWRRNSTISCFEYARSKLDSFPKLFNTFDGRMFQQKTIPSVALTSTRALPGPASSMPSLLERTGLDLKSRNYPISKTQHKHPEIIRAPLVTKADYAKGSLLAKNDVNRRYLNVKYEFALERYNAYVLEHQSKQENLMVQYRSGRTFLVPKTPILEDDADTNNNAEIQKSKNNLKLSDWNIKTCIACHRFTKTVCKICAMPYCHAECLKAVKEQHNEFCAAKSCPPSREKALPVYPNTGLPPSKETVRITAFEQTNVVYVISTERSVNIAHFSILQEVMSKGRNAAKLEKVPACGQIVIHKTETQTVRAMVVNAEHPNEIFVVCIDFGNIEMVELGNLYECCDYLAGLKVYPVAVQLRGVPRRFMNPNVQDLLYELSMDMIFKIKYSKREFNFNKGLQIVQLIENEFHRNLNRFIKTMLTPVEPSVPVKGNKEDYFPHIYLPTGRKLQLVVMDNSFLKYGLIYCTTVDLAYEVTKMQRDLQDYGDNIAKCDSFATSQGELCVAKYQGKWCRGVFQELVGDGYPSILFLDYGNIVPVHIQDIRPYPPEFRFPVVTSELELIGLPTNLSDKQLIRLEEYFGVGTFVECDEVILNNDANNYSVRFDILKSILA